MCFLSPINLIYRSVFFKIVADFKTGGTAWEVISAHYLLPIHMKIGQAVIGLNMDHYHISNLCKVISGHIFSRILYTLIILAHANISTQTKTYIFQESDNV